MLGALWLILVSLAAANLLWLLQPHSSTVPSTGSEKRPSLKRNTLVRHQVAPCDVANCKACSGTPRTNLTIAAITKAWSAHSYGGLGKHADNLYRSLVQRGHTVHVFTTDIRPTRAQDVGMGTFSFLKRVWGPCCVRVDCFHQV